MNTAQVIIPVQDASACIRKHVLLVDDDPAFRSYASMLLSRNGYRVSQACDGLEALQSVSRMLDGSDRIDLLFTDLKMENMSGMELITKVRALGLDVPVLVATGFLDEVSFQELQRINRHQLLVKPFKQQDLLLCVERLIASDLPY